MNPLLGIFLAGGLGSVLRFQCGKFITDQLNSPHWGTLSVNIIGCFLIGVLFQYFQNKSPDQETLNLALMTGFLGGFTTFSAFSLETFRFFQDGRFIQGLSYVGMSLIFCLAGTGLGVSLARLLFPSPL